MKHSFIYIAIYLLVLSCNQPLFTVDEKLRSDYSILGFVTVDSVQVKILKNHDYNVEITSEDNESVTDAEVILLDSLSQTLAILYYDDSKKSYYVGDLNLSNTGKYKIQVNSKELNASTTLVSIPDPIIIEKVSTSKNPGENDLTTMEVSLNWKPTENESLETKIYNMENTQLYITPLDFDHLSQCFNDYSFTLIYYPRCFNTKNSVTINQSYFLVKESYFGDFIPVKSLIFSACSKEYSEFINSIYFIENFERAFVNTSVIKSNIISDNCTGYFFGKATKIWNF